MRVISNAIPITRVVSGSKLKPSKNSLDGHSNKLAATRYDRLLPIERILQPSARMIGHASQI